MTQGSLASSQHLSGTVSTGMSGLLWLRRHWVQVGFASLPSQLQLWAVFCHSCCWLGHLRCLCSGMIWTPQSPYFCSLRLRVSDFSHRALLFYDNPTGLWSSKAHHGDDQVAEIMASLAAVLSYSSQSWGPWLKGFWQWSLAESSLFVAMLCWVSLEAK